MQKLANQTFRFAMAALTTTALVMPAAVTTAVVLTPTPALAKKSKDSDSSSTKSYKKLAKGTEFTIKLEDGLDSSKNTDGDTFSGAVATGLFGDKTLKGYTVNGHVEGVKSSKMGGKKGELDIVFDELVAPDGKTYEIEAALTKAPKPEGKFLRNAGIVLAGAVAGHHIGKKTNKKHGALLGAASAAAVALTMPGGDVVVKKGTKLEVRLEKGVKLKVEE